MNSTAEYKVVVGMATCGIAAGAGPVMETFSDEIEKLGLQNIEVTQTGCLGVCRLEPMVDIYGPNGEKTTYVKMTPEKAVQVAVEHLQKGMPVAEYEQDGTDLFYKQTRIALRNCGTINPENIDDYIAYNGYAALEKALTKMTPEEVLQELIHSGLKGRGGAGYPTGIKLQEATKSPGNIK